MTHNISVTMRDRELVQWATYRKHPLQVLWPRDRWRHVTLKGQGHDLKMFEAQYLGNRARYSVGVNGPPIWNHPLRVLWSRDRWRNVTQHVATLVPVLTNKVLNV